MKHFESFSKLKQHNLSLSAGSKTGTISSASEVRKEWEKSLPVFMEYVMGMRTGSLERENGDKYKAKHLNLKQALNLCFGIKPDFSVHNTKAKQHHFARESFLNQFGIAQDSHGFEDIGNILLGKTAFDGNDFAESMLSMSNLDFSSFAQSASNTAGTGSVDVFNWVILEMFLDIVNIGYEHNALYPNWIAQEITVTNRKKISMPQIRTGNTMMSHVAEGADIPYGSLQFGQKDVSISKHGVGITLTDELMRESNVDMAALYLSQVTNDMRIALDSEALFVLINGEQDSGSEAAPVVGVENPANGFTYRDTLKVFSRLNSLGFPANRLITTEDTGIDIKEIPEYKGYEGNRTFSNVQTPIIGTPGVFDIDVHVPPANQIMYVSPENAMVKLNAGGLMVERDRKIQNQTNRVFVSDTCGYAIVHSDARVLQDKTITGTDFPASMDFESRIKETYKTICD